MKKIYIWIACACLCWAAPGCKTNDIEDPIIVPEVKKEFIVEIMEQPGPAPRNLQINLRTVKAQDCLNTDIRYDLLELPARYRLDIHEIEVPADCMPGAVQARDSALMAPPANGLYGFDINLRNTVSNQGTLTAMDDRYILDMHTVEGLVIPNTHLRRIPNFTIWGYIASFSLATGNAVNSFVNEVAALSDVASFPPGYYGHFTIPSGSGPIAVNDTPQSLAQRTFVYRFSGNLDDLRSLVQNYRNTHGGLIQIRLQTISGESL